MVMLHTSVPLGYPSDDIPRRGETHPELQSMTGAHIYSVLPLNWQRRYATDKSGNPLPAGAARHDLGAL